MRQFPLIFIACLIAITKQAAAADIGLKIKSTKLVSGTLTVSLTAEGLFTERALDLLHKEFTTVVKYTVELWRAKRYSFDDFVARKKMTYNIDFDMLKGEYKIARKVDGEMKQPLSSEDLYDVLSAVTEGVSIKLVPIKKLNPDYLYYFTASVERKAVTAEDIEDLRRWLTELEPPGNKSPPEERSSWFTRKLFQVAANFLSSQNTAKRSVRSRRFSLKNLVERRDK